MKKNVKIASLFLCLIVALTVVFVPTKAKASVVGAENQVWADGFETNVDGWKKIWCGRRRRNKFFNIFKNRNKIFIA